MPRTPPSKKPTTPLTIRPATPKLWPAIENLFGDHALKHKLLVSSTKSMTGHLLGGAGGLEAGITIMAMLEQTAPPTMNIVELDPQCRLNYVPNTPQPLKIDYALSNSFGFGGTNGSLVFKRWTE